MHCEKWGEEARWGWVRVNEGRCMHIHVLHVVREAERCWCVFTRCVRVATPDCVATLHTVRQVQPATTSSPLSIHASTLSPFAPLVVTLQHACNYNSNQIFGAKSINALLGFRHVLCVFVSGLTKWQHASGHERHHSIRCALSRNASHVVQLTSGASSESSLASPLIPMVAANNEMRRDCSWQARAGTAQRSFGRRHATLRYVASVDTST